MSLKIFNDIIALLANALRFYALKYFVGIFVQKEESRWKHVSILYIIGWAWTSAISLLFSSPAMNILSNITSLFLIFFPYRIKKTKKCLAVFIICNPCRKKVLGIRANRRDFYPFHCSYCCGSHLHNTSSFTGH